MRTPSTNPIARATTSCLFLLPLVLLACPILQAQTASPTLAALQHDYAMRYLEPEPHMALAKYHFDHGNRLLAFFISEAARRERFEEKIFDPAFYRAFDGFDNTKAAEARLLAEFARQPESADITHDLADIYISREDYVNAKRYLLIGTQKHPEDYRFTGGLAMVLGRQGKQREADQLDKDYMRKFPNSAIAYATRAEALTKTNPLEAKIILAEAFKRYPNDGQLLFDLRLFTRVKITKKLRRLLLGPPSCRRSRRWSNRGPASSSSRPDQTNVVRCLTT